MFATIAILLLGFAVRALTQGDFECGPLRECLRKDREKRNQDWQNCHSRCAGKLPGNLQRKGCFERKHDDDENLWQVELACVFKTGYCHGPFNAPCDKSHGPGDPHQETHYGEGRSDLKDYHGCMRDCVKPDVRQQDLRFQGRSAAFDVCKARLGSSITSEQVKNAHCDCRRPEWDNRRKDIDQRFRECINTI